MGDIPEGTVCGLRTRERKDKKGLVASTYVAHQTGGALADLQGGIGSIVAYGRAYDRSMCSGVLVRCTTSSCGPALWGRPFEGRLCVSGLEMAVGGHVLGTMSAALRWHAPRADVPYKTRWQSGPELQEPY